MLKGIFYILAGYLCGSIMFARICEKIFNKSAITGESADGNPGAFNAFEYGGFTCGVITLLGDVAKGFVPVFFYFHTEETALKYLPLTALVFAAPVIGHILPVFFKFKGGKGISTTFGCLVALVPIIWKPFVIFAACFILFSTVLQINPNYYRTMVSYITAFAFMVIVRTETGITIGFFLIAAFVLIRLFKSKEEKEKFNVKLLGRGAK